MSSQERQEIIAVLKGAGEPISVSQIMAAIEPTNRNAVDRLLGKMHKAGEIERAGRGLYTVPDQNINSGKIEAPVSAPVQSDRQSDQYDLTDTESGKIEVAVRLQETPDQPWRISDADADAARRAERYRTARREKGEAIANRALRWELQDAGVPYQQLQREVDRIRRLAGC